MVKTCVFESNKVCNNCGECNICDLDSNKLCNNCGKCLQLEGYDVKAIDIDEIIDDLSEVNEYDTCEEKIEDINIDIDSLKLLNRDLKDSDISLEYIDDVDGLNDLLDNIDNSDEVIKEVFPGLLIVNKKNKK